MTDGETSLLELTVNHNVMENRMGKTSKYSPSRSECIDIVIAALKDKYVTVDELVGCLPPSQSMIFSDRIVEGLTTGEISKRRGYSTGGVSSTYTCAIERVAGYVLLKKKRGGKRHRKNK